MEKDQDHGEIREAADDADADIPNATTTHEEIQNSTEEAIPQYIAGVKLWTLLASVTLIVFLVMLDMSIIATVSLQLFSSP